VQSSWETCQDGFLNFPQVTNRHVQLLRASLSADDMAHTKVVFVGGSDFLGGRAGGWERSLRASGFTDGVGVMVVNRPGSECRNDLAYEAARATPPKDLLVAWQPDLHRPLLMARANANATATAAAAVASDAKSTGTSTASASASASASAAASAPSASPADSKSNGTGKADAPADANANAAATATATAAKPATASAPPAPAPSAAPATAPASTSGPAAAAAAAAAATPSTSTSVESKSPASSSAAAVSAAASSPVLPVLSASEASWHASFLERKAFFVVDATAAVSSTLIRSLAKAQPVTRETRAQLHGLLHEAVAERYIVFLNGPKPIPPVNTSY
jgi:hypothetical protein